MLGYSTFWPCPEAEGDIEPGSLSHQCYLFLCDGRGVTGQNTRHYYDLHIEVIIVKILHRIILTGVSDYRLQ